MRGAAAAVALVTATALVVPAQASAGIPVPLLPDLPTPGLPSAGDLVRSILRALFELLFGDIPKAITRAVLEWLLTHPDFGEGGRFDTLERGAAAVREVSYGLAVGFYCAGLARRVFDDATEGALEATRRFVFAVAGITLWPWAFGLAVRFSNLATLAFLEVPELSRTTVALLSFAFIAGGAMGIGFICGLLAAVMLILLFLEKVLVLTGLTVLYVLMPALMAASPFPPTAHLLGVGAAAFTAVLVLNPIWTALLAVFALVGEGALTVGAAAVADFVEPLIAIAMLVLVVGALPVLLRLAWVRGVAVALMTPTVGAGHGGGSVLATAARTAHAARGVRSMLEHHSSERLQASAWQVNEAPPAAAAGPAGLAFAAAEPAASRLPGHSRSTGATADPGGASGGERGSGEHAARRPPDTPSHEASFPTAAAEPPPVAPWRREPEKPPEQLRLPLDRTEER